ncbi:hypothetical protein QJQ45_010969 [Haematococcus lacustris]|nr:hypothetical protein QJQ45_010969 [Haematococcus lacustris]
MGRHKRVKQLVTFFSQLASTPGEAGVLTRCCEPVARCIEIAAYRGEQVAPAGAVLVAKGKEYPEVGYKRLRDQPPKAQQQQQPAKAQMRRYWTDLCDIAAVATVLAYADRGHAQVQDVLDPGRRAPLANSWPPPPALQYEVAGQHLCVLPTLVATPQSYAFRSAGPGFMINPDGTCSEPTVPERDRALGYGTGATAAPGVSLPQRFAILGQVAAAEEGSGTDASALHFLRNIAHLPGMTATKMRRVVRRANRYEADHLLRVMTYGSAKVVPAPATRDQLVLCMHGSNGHFGLSPLPVQGLFYRWGVDLAGPLPRTHRGNEYLLVCIEHLTKHVELVPNPDRLANTTTYHFHHQVLSCFGGIAEVLTDGGREFQGEFADLLQRHLTDHRVTFPHHPQADGLAERAVQPLKNALRKHIAVSGDPAAWDEPLPAIALGYCASPQEATKCNPYSLLHCCAPLLPPAVVQRMARPVNLDDPVVAAHDLPERSAVLHRETVAAMGNIRIAQHSWRQ